MYSLVNWFTICIICYAGSSISGSGAPTMESREILNSFPNIILKGLTHNPECTVMLIADIIVDS